MIALAQPLEIDAGRRDRLRGTSHEIRSRSSARHGSRTARCSVTDRDDVPAVCGRRAASPLIARLFDSVAPLVNTTSRNRAPMSAATCSRALFDGLAGLPAERMIPARRVAEVLREKRQHGIEHARIDRSRRVGVEIDGVHGVRSDRQYDSRQSKSTEITEN